MGRTFAECVGVVTVLGFLIEEVYLIEDVSLNLNLSHRFLFSRTME
jgi:hypothetical protein